MPIIFTIVDLITEDLNYTYKNQCIILDMICVVEQAQQQALCAEQVPLTTHKFLLFPGTELFMFEAVFFFLLDCSDIHIYMK